MNLSGNFVTKIFKAYANIILISKNGGLTNPGPRRPAGKFWQGAPDANS
jgi:hypothetical protein